MEIFGRTWVGIFVGFWVGGHLTRKSQLARRKLCKKIHPDHGGRRRPTAAMVPSPRRRDHTAQQVDVVKTRFNYCH
jgi:hypothetical protein